MKLYVFLLFLNYAFLVCSQSEYIYSPTVNMYYKFYSTPKLWFDARNICKSDNATLAMPKNHEEAQNLASMFEKNKKRLLPNVNWPHINIFLLGFHDIFQENEFITLYGHPIQNYYHRWHPIEPNLGRSENCGSMDNDLLFYDYPCGVVGSFFCEKNNIDKNTDILPHYKDSDYECMDTSRTCYKMHLNPQLWANARVICQAEGGHLAIVRNKEQQDKLVEIFTRIGPHEINNVIVKDNAFIGVHDLYRENHFVTVLDEDFGEIGYANWINLEPSGEKKLTKEQNCVSFINTGQLNVSYCDIPGIFFCEKTKIDVDPTFLNNYIYNRELDAFYKLHSNEVNYGDAASACQAEGALLAVPTSQKEISYMMGFHTDIWIGINDIAQEGNYVAVDEEYNSKLLLNWEPGEPNDTGSEDCIYMYKYPYGTYNDVSCDMKRSFLCKKVLDKNTEVTKKVVSKCKETSKTTVKENNACKGELIFEENFDNNNIKGDKWNIEHRLPYEDQDFGFLSYQESSIHVIDNKLTITPSLQQESLGFNKNMIIHGALDLTMGCTAKLQKYCQIQADSFNILPPVISGRVTTQNKFSFKYGKIVIKAKLPQGNWLFPELYLEPAIGAYGIGGYESGAIRIAFARGNMELAAGKTEYGNKILSGGVILEQFEPCRSKGIVTSPKKDEPWGNAFHEYGLIWDEDKIILEVDNEVYGTIEPPDNGFKAFGSDKVCKSIATVINRWAVGSDLAPFDQEFYLTIGLGVGGIADFPNNVVKPWKNKSPKARKTFWKDLRNWHSTWTNENKKLIVESIKVYAL